MIIFCVINQQIVNLPEEIEQMNSFNIKLQEFAENKRIVEKAWNSFWKTYDYFLSECKEESVKSCMSNRENIKTELYELAYERDNDNKFVVNIQITDLSDDDLGYYKVYFDENGEAKEDILVLE